MGTRQAAEADIPAIGVLLKHWRHRRGVSQLTLALDVGVSARHLSFIESGRSAPSREMVLRLARGLRTPYRETNDMLEAAGYARAYRERTLDEPALHQACEAVRYILEHQEPYPAIVMDRYWNVMQANRAAQRFFAKLLGDAELEGPPNVVRMIFHPAGLRPWIENWEEVAEALVSRMHREAVGGALDLKAHALLEEALAYPGVPKRLCAREPETIDKPLVELRFRKGEMALDFFSMVTTLGTPRDIALQELRIECFFPANQRTREAAPALY